MSNIYGAETQLLGGFGGWGGGYGGGYGCGIPAVGLFGIADGFGRRGFDGHDGHKCGCGCSPCQCAQHTEAVILDDAHYNSLQASIGGVKDTVITVKDNITALGYNIGDKFAMTDAAIAQVGYQGAINTKDIIHNEDKGFCGTNHNLDNKFFALSKQLSDCCCELQKEGLKNTQVILDKLNATEIQELRDKLCRCEKENDFFRFNGAISANLASFRAATAGSNFNTGTQSSNTSNNSGQQVGAQS